MATRDRQRSGYDALVLAPHADDAETQMGGTLAKLADRGQRILLVDLTTGEPTELAAPGRRGEQAAEAARILGVDRVCLGLQDRLLEDTMAARIQVARLMAIALFVPRRATSGRRRCGPSTTRR